MKRCFLFTKTPDIGVVYIHVPGDENHHYYAHRFVHSVLAGPPGMEADWIIVRNGHTAMDPKLEPLFNCLGAHQFFDHDDTGWDIGAYQAVCAQSKHEMLVFLGGSAYCKRAGWLARMYEVFSANGGRGLFGACGNLGDSRSNVYPHIRTTGFWCSPQHMHYYPHKVTTPGGRYPFEHGPENITRWTMNSGLPALIVDWDGVYEYPKWNDGPNGFHRGDQSALIMGDRLTAPPYYHAG